MLIAYIILTTIISMFFAYIWATTTAMNVLLKCFFSFVSLFGLYLLFNLLPQVVLTNGMRLL